MFLESPMGIFDYDLQELEELLYLLDARLDRIKQQMEDCSDPDAFGFYDRVEATVGLGFVACQQYLSATFGWLKVEKHSALLAGSKHHSGMYIAEIINHAANYWKHHDEWRISGKAHTGTINALQKLGFTANSDYVLSNILREAASPKAACFQSIIPKLENWRDALRA